MVTLKSLEFGGYTALSLDFQYKPLYKEKNKSLDSLYSGLLMYPCENCGICNGIPINSLHP